MSQVSRAAVFHAPGQPLRIECFPLPSPLGREAVARVRCATICGSDLHTVYGRRPSPAPAILGHEIVGEICAIGPEGAFDFNGALLSLGDRVTWSMVWSCGNCYYCRRGLRPKCERLMKFGHESIEPGRGSLGGFAEHCFLREGTAIFRVPRQLPDFVACPANCATATVAAVFRHAGDVEGESVVVIGAGMLGLTACAMASAQNARCVIAVESDPARAAIARHFGATHTLDGNGSSAVLRHQVCEANDGRGAAVVMEFSGAPEAIESGFELLDFGGRFILAGATYPARSLHLPADQIVRRMVHLIGVYNYRPEDLASALEFLSAHFMRFPFESLVGRAFSLSEAQAAIEFAETNRPPRVAILPFRTKL